MSLPLKQLDIDAGPLWDAYQADRCIERRNALVEHYRHLAGHIVGRMSLGNFPASDMGDHVSNATIGLIQAVESFDPSRGTRFTTYAVLRVRGAVKDGLRELDFVPRLVRASGEETRQILTGAEDDVLAETVADNLESPEWSLMGDSTWDELIQPLSARERAVCELHFRRGLTMQETGERIGVSESRVSQMMTGIYQQLRDAHANRNQYPTQTRHGKTWTQREDVFMPRTTVNSTSPNHTVEECDSKVAYHLQEAMSWLTLKQKLSTDKATKSRPRKKRPRKKAKAS